MNQLSAIQSPIEKEMEVFKQYFSEALSTDNSLLNEVLNYIGQRNGKRMRPVLVFLIAKLYGEVGLSTYYSAVALELLHTASLIHDDVVDESDKRRGQPSVNALYDNRVAVLVGDFLFAACLTQVNKTQDHRIIDVVSKLGRDLSEGELLQLSIIDFPELTEEDYFNVIRKKTAALFSSCAYSAAYSVNASDRDCENARLFGEYLGLCFQIRDDIFDYYTDEEIGKPTGNDMLEGKLTLPAIYVLNNTDSASAKLLAEKVKQGTASADDIGELVEFVKQNGGVDYAVQVMKNTQQKAENLLADLPDSDVKSALKEYLNYVIDRKL